LDSQEDCWCNHWTAFVAAFARGPIELGGAVSVRPKAQILIAHGLYSRMRNPIYVFAALTIAGFFLYINLPRGLAIFVVLIPLQTYRARQEEKF
jgi:protein-S-isoprenylcysteine O-methyltransferase Ste14